MGNERATVREAALAYLGAHRVMTLATDGPQGLWAAAVFYANEAFTLYFLSAPHTRHATNIHAQPRVAATVQEDYADWQAIKGIQLEGVVSPLAGKAEEHAIAVYGEKYPFITEQAGKAGDVGEALSGIRWYRLIPDRLYYIDNEKGLGHRDEVLLGED